jgi:flavodoxin
LIVYSQTGHTLAVAQELEAALAEAGHTVALEQIEPTGRVGPGQTDVTLAVSPAIDGYDALVLGASTWGATMASPMAGYLAQIDSLEGKTVALLVTGALPAGRGRNQTLAQMKEMYEAKGATVAGTGSVRLFPRCIPLDQWPLLLSLGTSLDPRGGSLSPRTADGDT